MSKTLSVIVTVRGEENKLHQTIANIHEKAGVKTEIVVVYDGTKPDTSLDVDQILVREKPLGIGPARHKGIQAARYANVFLTDAHMNFEEGFGAVVCDHLSQRENAQDVVCGMCRPSDTSLNPAGSAHSAARFGLMSEEPGGEHWCLSGKWAKQDLGEIGCVYGACYAFKRSWYKKIGAPLEMLRGWWGDEEYLSIASWLAGGRCILLPFWVAHLFRDKPSFKRTREDAFWPTINRARLIHLFPCSDEMREDFEAWHSCTPRTIDTDYSRMLADDLSRDVVVSAKELWASWADQVDGFMSRWVDEHVAPLSKRNMEREGRRPWKNEKAPDPVPRVQRRDYIVCANCGGRNTFLVTSTQQRKGYVIRYGKCKSPHCGVNGKMIDRPEGQIVYWGRDADLSQNL